MYGIACLVQRVLDLMGFFCPGSGYFFAVLTIGDNWSSARQLYCKACPLLFIKLMVFAGDIDCSVGVIN